MQLPELEVEPYLKPWRERLARERAANAAAHAEAREAAKRCARVLIDEFDARRVFLFGSLVSGDPKRYTERSDVDLAAEGIEPRRYWKALGCIEEILPRGRDYHLVLLESAAASLRETVLQRGEVLDERA